MKFSESTHNHDFSYDSKQQMLPSINNSKQEASIINLEADIELNLPKRNNKNDFYRFLLA